jgi:hypothetical protein
MNENEPFLRELRGIWPCCPNCAHWGKGVEHHAINSEVCIKANGERPPATVIAFGCPAYERDLPF